MLGAESTQSICYYFYNDDVSQFLNFFCTKIWILLNKLEHETIEVPLSYAARELLSAYCMEENYSFHHPLLPSQSSNSLYIALLPGDLPEQ